MVLPDNEDDVSSTLMPLSNMSSRTLLIEISFPMEPSIVDGPSTSMWRLMSSVVRDIGKGMAFSSIVNTVGGGNAAFGLSVLV